MDEPTSGRPHSRLYLLLKIVVLFVLLVPIYALISGGGVVVTSRFELEELDETSLGHNLIGSIYASSEWTRWSIPYLFHYHYGGPPYSLGLFLHDEENAYVALVIEEIRVDYSDGIVIQHNQGWRMEFVSSTRHNGGFKRTSQKIFQRVNGIIERTDDVTVTVSGFLVKPGEVKIPFTKETEFKAEHRRTFKSGWAAMADV